MDSEQSFSFDNWMFPPHNRESFHNVKEVVPTALIENKTSYVRELPQKIRDFTGLSVDTSDGLTENWQQHLQHTNCDAICIVHDGSIVHEQYFGTNTETSRHLLMSVSKSFCAAALGVSINRGVLHADELVTQIDPRFFGTSLEGATIQHLIDMTAGTDFVEDYDAYASPSDSNLMIQYEQQAGWRPINDLPVIGAIEHFITYGKSFEHGTRFDYRSPLTNIVAYLLERVNGKSFAEILSQDIWGPLGFEHPGDLMLDPLGSAVIEGGLNCTVRDLARFGLAYLENGLVNHAQAMSESWIHDTFNPNNKTKKLFGEIVQPNGDDPLHGTSVAYHNGFWVKSTNEIIECVGIFGQYCYIHRPSRTVIARFSSYELASPTELVHDVHRGFDSVVSALS